MNDDSLRASLHAARHVFIRGKHESTTPYHCNRCRCCCRCVVHRFAGCASSRCICESGVVDSCERRERTLVVRTWFKRRIDHCVPCAWIQAARFLAGLLGSASTGINGSLFPEHHREGTRRMRARGELVLERAQHQHVRCGDEHVQPALHGSKRLSSRAVRWQAAGWIGAHARTQLPQLPDVSGRFVRSARYVDVLAGQPGIPSDNTSSSSIPTTATSSRTRGMVAIGEWRRSR